MRRTKFICDNCGEETNQIKNWDTPLNWLRLERIHLVYRKSRTKQWIKEENKLIINESKDPEFCSEECFIKWIKKQIKKIQKL